MPNVAAEKFAKSLSVLEARISEAPHTTKFSDSWGVQALCLDKHDLAYMVSELAERVKSIDWSNSENAEDVFNDLTTKVAWVTDNHVPNLWSNSPVSDTLLGFLYSVDFQISSLASVDLVKNALSIPVSLRRNINAVRLRLDEATNSIDGIQEKIRSINSAHDAAERLPVTMADLNSALSQVDRAAKDAERLNVKSGVTAEEVEALKINLQAAEAEAQTVLTKLRAAYRATTSQGLAQAFFDKSEALNQSMNIWIIGLISSLIVAGILAHQRFPAILNAVSGTPDWGVVLLHVVLGGLSVAPAIWVAWIATKQIGQRFRLAEDYAYKAALSTAYEGYRSEASKLDPLFEAQLFATALGRLDELPLRLVERDVHGSPWHELVQSSEFKEAVKKFPNLKERIAAIFYRKKSTQDSNVKADTDDT